jgi:hypothetical protein
MRPLSVIADLEEVIEQACDEAVKCGLEPDQVVSIIRETLEKWEREAPDIYDLYL